MNVKIELSPEVEKPYAVIYTRVITSEITTAIEALEALGESQPVRDGSEVILARQDEKLLVLNPKDVFMVRMEAGEVVLYTELKKYTSGKRLYEVEKQLGKEFLRISKTTIINLKQIDSVEPSFDGMVLFLKNGLKDYISRKYMKEFKAYLGL